MRTSSVNSIGQWTMPYDSSVGPRPERRGTNSTRSRAPSWASISIPGTLINSSSLIGILP